MQNSVKEDRQGQARVVIRYEASPLHKYPLVLNYWNTITTIGEKY